jgi:hypothetical protein
MSGQLHAPAALLSGKEPLVSTGQEAVWAPEPFWRWWWREQFPAPAGNRTLEPRSSSPLPNKRQLWIMTHLLYPPLRPLWLPAPQSYFTYLDVTQLSVWYMLTKYHLVLHVYCVLPQPAMAVSIIRWTLQLPPDMGLVAGLNSLPPYPHRVHTTRVLWHCEQYTDQWQN